MTGLNSLIQLKDLEQEKMVNFFFADLYIIEIRFCILPLQLAVLPCETVDGFHHSKSSCYDNQ